MIATFIGHRKIQNSELLTEQIKQTVLNLIDEKQVDTFLFGSRSAFDDLCLETVTEIKKISPHIKRIYVRAAYPYIDSAYEAYLLKFYDATYIAGFSSAAYEERPASPFPLSDCVRPAGSSEARIFRRNLRN